MSAGGAFGWLLVRSLQNQPLQEERCRSRHPNQSNQVREVFGGSRAGRGAPRSLCPLAGQVRHVPRPEPRFRDRRTRVGVVAFAPGDRSQDFRGIKKFSFLKRTHPRFFSVVIRCNFPIDVMATSHWRFPGRQGHWSPLGGKKKSLEMVFSSATSSFFFFLHCVSVSSLSSWPAKTNGKCAAYRVGWVSESPLGLYRGAVNWP